MKIDTKIVLVNLRGEPLRTETGDLTLGEAVSNILVTAKEGGKMKTFTLAQDFYSKDSVTLDKADFNLVKTTIEKTEVYNSLVSGQVLTILSDITE